MVFVTLGTQDKSFKRLLDGIQKQIDLGNIKDKVIVQAGSTKYDSNDMEIYDLVSTDKFNKYIKDCDLLITHGGVGSILNGLKNNKKIIVVPRLQKYDEHENDHQLQIVEYFKSNSYVLATDNIDELDILLKEVKKFKTKKYKSNNKNFIKYLEDFIDGNNKKF